MGRRNGRPAETLIWQASSSDDRPSQTTRSVNLSLRLDSEISLKAPTLPHAVMTHLQPTLNVAIGSTRAARRAGM